MKPHARLTLVFSVLTALVLTANGFAQPRTVPHELAQRLAGAGATLYIGELPPKELVGFDLPLLQRTRVVGANAWTDTDPAYSTLYFSSEQGVADVKAFYLQAFRDLGWRLGQAYQQTGFLPSGEGEAVNSLSFCHRHGNSQTDVYLTLSPRRQNTWIDAQVSTYDRSQGSSPCDENAHAHHEPPIPPLVAPADSETTALESFSGFTQGNGSSVVVLETSLNTLELLGHYAQQLELSGWQMDAISQSGAAQLATYRFRDRGEAFVGTLQVVPLEPGAGYLAQITVVNP